MWTERSLEIILTTQVVLLASSTQPKQVRVKGIWGVRELRKSKKYLQDLKMDGYKERLSIHTIYLTGLI